MKMKSFDLKQEKENFNLKRIKLNKWLGISIMQRNQKHGFLNRQILKMYTYIIIYIYIYEYIYCVFRTFI